MHLTERRLERWTVESVESSRDPVGGHKSVGWQSDTEAVDSALSRTFELVNITVVKIGDCQHIFYSDKISGN